jgi:hypothetical protein
VKTTRALSRVRKNRERLFWQEIYAFCDAVSCLGHFLNDVFPSDAVLKNPVKTETPTAIMFNYRYSPVRF